IRFVCAPARTDRRLEGVGQEIRQERPDRRRRGDRATGAPQPATTKRVLSMELRLGDRLTDATSEHEVIGRPYTTNAGKSAHVGVKRVDNAEVTMMRTYGAHEHISVKRASAEEG